MNTIGQSIKSLRKLAGLSQEELSKAICSQAQLSKMENKNEIPSSMVLYKLSRKLGVDMNYFFEIMETPRFSIATWYNNGYTVYEYEMDKASN